MGQIGQVPFLGWTEWVRQAMWVYSRQALEKEPLVQDDFDYSGFGCSSVQGGRGIPPESLVVSSLCSWKSWELHY